MRIQRFVFIAAIVLFFLVSLLFGAALYLYHNPSLIKSLIEDSISDSLRSTCTIEHFSFTLRPLRMEARGVVARSVEKEPELRLELPEFVANMNYLGPFRHRRLIIENMTLTNPSLRADLEHGLPRLRTEQKPSLLSRILSGMVQSFLISDIQVKKGRVTNGSMLLEKQGRELRIQDLLGQVSKKGTDISCNMGLTWPSANIRLVNSQVHITAPGLLNIMSPELGGRIRIRAASFESPYLLSEGMDLDARFSYNHSRKKIHFPLLRVQMATLFLSGGSENPADLTLEAEGSFDLEEKSLHASRFEVSVPDLVSIRGSGRTRLGLEPACNVSLEEGRLVVRNAVPFLPPNLRGALPSLNLSGAVLVTGEIHGNKKEQWDWTCDLETKLVGNEIALIHEDVRFKSLCSGTVRLSGPFPHVSLHSEITGKQTVLQGETWGLKPFGWNLTLNGTYPSFRIPSLEAQIPEARLSVGEKDQTMRDLRVRMKDGVIQLRDRSISLPSIQLDSDLLKNLSLEATVRGTETRVEAKGEEVGLVQCLRGLGRIEADWQMRAEDSIEATFFRHASGGWSVQSRMHITNLTFQNPQGTFMGDQLSAVLRWDAEQNRAQSVISQQGKLEISSGELLYDRFYGNLGDNSFDASWEAVYDFDDKSLHVSDLQLELQHIARVRAEGVLTPTDLRMQLKIPKTPILALYEMFLQEPFQAEKPVLKKLDVAGDMEANVNFEYGDTHWSAKGHILWNKGSLSNPGKNLQMEGIHLDLPVWLTNRRGATHNGVHIGDLSLASLKLPYLLNQPLKLELHSEPNRITIRKPTRIQTIGGDVILEPVTLRLPVNDTPGLGTSLVIKDLKLDPFLSEFWPHAVEGKLKGELTSVQLDGNKLTTTGRLSANVFGGKIVLDQLRASGLVTPAPVLSLDAELEGLQLGELTEDTSFGKIQGVLQGHIHDLEIAYGQPQQFDMVLETVKTEGIPQRISVKAVDNIAQIGGGQSPFMGLAGGLAALFKDFPYEKMGVHARLENDVFRINGTIEEGGTEYLVKRGGLSGVNVVNQNPDNRISFKDMVKRMKRIGSGGGPVIQ